jgi:hypothetical protein
MWIPPAALKRAPTAQAGQTGFFFFFCSEHSVAFREHSVTFREHSVAFREQSVAFRDLYLGYGKQDPEAKDITFAVQGALQGAVLLEAFPKAIVDVQILVVEGQGGDNAHMPLAMRFLVYGSVYRLMIQAIYGVFTCKQVDVAAPTSPALLD